MDTPPKDIDHRLRRLRSKSAIAPSASPPRWRRLPAPRAPMRRARARFGPLAIRSETRRQPARRRAVLAAKMSRGKFLCFSEFQCIISASRECSMPSRSSLRRNGADAAGPAKRPRRPPPPTPVSFKCLKRNRTAKPTKASPHDFNGLRKAQTKRFISPAKRNGQLAPKGLENGAGLSRESQLGESNKVRNRPVSDIPGRHNGRAPEGHWPQSAARVRRSPSRRTRELIGYTRTQ